MTTQSVLRSGTLALLVAAQAFPALKLPPGFIEKRLGEGLSDPTALAMAPDGSGFLAERGGRIYRIKGDTLVALPILTIPVDTAGDRGLLGLALDPAFATNPRLYAAYFTSQPSGSQLRLVSYPVEGERIDAAKESLVLALPNAGAATANLGGALACGPDGKLFLGIGDLQQPELAQDLSATNGKILRLSTNGFIPNDNPYYATGTGHGKAVWAYGLGDPVGLVFQPGTGTLMVNDAKAGSFQEVNVAVAGGNYGWPAVSGPSTDARFRPPFHAYPASEGCGTRGGDFHVAGRVRFPAEFAGDFLTADACGGWVRRLASGTGERKDFIDGIQGPAVLRFGPQGDLYFATQSGLHRLTYAPELAIEILTHPEDVAVDEGASATFKVTVKSPPPIRYQWRKNGADIPGATAASLTLASATSIDNGARFSVTVSNDHGSVESRTATVTVGKSQIAPKVTVQPADIAVRVGTKVTFAVVAEGTAPLSFKWNRKGVPIPGATGAAYTLATTTLADNGSDFFVEISNMAGLVTSRRAILTVVTTGINPLAEVHWTTVANGRGPVEADMSGGESDAGDGDMLSIGDRLYDRGLGVYANSEISLNLSNACDSLYAEVGVDGEKGLTGTVVFEVMADGASLYRSQIMNRSSPPVKLALSLTGKGMLKLRVTDAGDQSGNDYANWADTRIKCWENFVPVRKAAKAVMKTPRPGWYLLGASGGTAGFPSLPKDSKGAVRIHDLRGRVLLEHLFQERQP